MNTQVTQLPWTATSDGFIAASSEEMNGGFYIARVYGPDAILNLPYIVNAVNVYSANQARIVDLEAALSGLVKRHVELVESGDCGFWNVENEDAMIAARSVLSNGEGSATAQTGGDHAGEN